jgi:beta-phosphoglucomutase-like phosphatase (HAD superfamily)
MAMRPAWPEPPVTLNTIAAGWRVALAAAHHALAASSACPTETLLPSDLRQRTSQLTREREQVAALLDADARQAHIHLVRRLSLPTTTRAELGLPSTIDVCLFDLDGVLTATADLHFRAWAATFDTFLLQQLERGGVHFAHYARFSRRADYDELIHGKPRLDGVRAFLASRGLALPEGTPDDPPTAETVWGLANRKNVALGTLIRHEGVSAYAGTHRYLEAVADAGLACIVISASANTAAILERAGIDDLVDFRIDGITMRTQDLQPKPAPDTLTAACALLGLAPGQAAAYETTAAGVTAARSAGIGLVVGVDRSEDAQGVSDTDLAVGDLAELLKPRIGR